MPDELKVMDTIDKFSMPDAKEGHLYQTESGAQFVVRQGKVVVTKTFGCLGCDMNWNSVAVRGKPGHEINAESVMYCTRLYDTPIATEDEGKAN